MKIYFTSLLLVIIFISYGQYKPGELELKKIEKLRSEFQPNVNGNRGAPEQDCNSALAVCQSTFVQPAAYSGIGTQQEVPSSSCLGSLEKNSVWYIFTVQTAGTLTFTIDPNTNSDDYDFALYNITGKNCSDVKSGAAPEVRCNYCVDPGNTGLSSAGSNASEDCCTNSPGCQFSTTLNVTVGQTFVLTVSNFTSSNSGYTLTFGGTSNIFDNVAASPLSAITPCGANYLTLQMSEAALCSSIAANGSDFTLTGPGGPFTITGATGINCGNSTSQIQINFSPQVTIGQNYTIGVKTGNDGNSLIDNCGNQAAGGTSLTFTATPPSPLITAPNSFCKGSNVTLSASIGTGYLWTPGGATTQTITVSPANTTTYSVIIQNGSCVQNVSHTLTVRPSPVANFTFSPLSPCAGDPVAFTNTSVLLKKCTGGGPYCVNNSNCGFLSSCVVNGAIYVWEFGDGGNSTAKNPSHTYNTPGTYNVTLTVHDFFNFVIGCSNKIIIPITVVPSIGPVAITGNNLICAGSSTTLTASNGSTYSWTSNPAGFTSTNPVITVSPLTTTTYTVTSPGCISNSSASTTVTVSTLPRGLYAMTTADYVRLNPLTGAILNTVKSALSQGWVNAAFTIHEQGDMVYWLSEDIKLHNLNLATGVETTINTSISTLPFFWGLRYYNGMLYTLTTSVSDNDKKLVRINPITGLLDATFPGIELNGSVGLDLSFGSSPVINPISGRYMIPVLGNKILSFDINNGTSNIIDVTGYTGTPSMINLLEINQFTGKLYALSGFRDIIRITLTSLTTATSTLVKTLTTSSGFTNPISAFDSESDLYFFQAEQGCSFQNPLITVNVNTGQEWCSDSPGLALKQMEFLNCLPVNVLRHQ